MYYSITFNSKNIGKYKILKKKKKDRLSTTQFDIIGD